MNHTLHSWLKTHVWQPFAGLDLRSLALLRVALAVTMLVNIGLYWPDAETFFADMSGFFLRTEAIRSQSLYSWSLLYVSSAPIVFHLFFLVYSLAALGMLFGTHTRLMVFMCWLCTVSLKTRGFAFTSLADTQLVVLLFWAMFLPLGARFSVDAALRKTPHAGNHYASVAALGLALNITYLYFFGALEKTGAAWLTTFDAVFYALNDVETTTPLAPYLLMFEPLLRVLTMGIYYLELFAVALLFLPTHTAAGRMVIVPLLMLLHVGFALFLSIGIFPLVSLSGLCALLPSPFWDRLLTRWNTWPRRQNIAIFYDRDCEFCLKCCLIFRTLGLPAATPILPAQGDATAGAIFEREQSWVVHTHDGNHLTGWKAASYLWRRSPLLFPLGFLFMLPGCVQLGEVIYRLIARHRQALATISARLLPRHEAPLIRPARLTNLLLVLLVVLVLAGNINNIIGSRETWPRWADATLRMLALDQRWSMYAPYPPRNSNWLVVMGTLEQGALVDVMHGRLSAPSFDRPHDGWDMFPDFRWRKYFSSINWYWQGPRVIGYYCRKWHRQHADAPLKSIEIFRYSQPTSPPGAATIEVKSNSVFRGDCPKP